MSLISKLTKIISSASLVIIANGCTPVKVDSELEPNDLSNNPVEKTEEISSQDLEQDSSNSVYEITWKFCGDSGKISDADEDGCVKSASPIYIWAEEQEFSPSVLLVRKSTPLGSMPNVEYGVAILAQGCFPHHPNPQELNFYSGNRIIFVEKNFAADRKVIDEVDFESKVINSQEELAKIRGKFNASSGVSTFGGSCSSLKKYNQRLAPYLPSPKSS